MQKNLLLVCGLLLLGTAASAEPLFQIEQRLSDVETKSILAGRAAEQYTVRVDPKKVAEDPGSIEIELPDGRRLEADRSVFHVYDPKWKTWAGDVYTAGGDREAEEPGLLFLSYYGDYLSGILNLGREQYQLAIVDGEHRFVRLSEKRGKSCGNGERGRDLHPDPRLKPLTDFGSVDTAPVADTDAVATKSILYIDVLAIYPKVITGFTNLLTLQVFVQDSIGLANYAFDEDNIDVRYRLVGLRRLEEDSESDDQPQSYAASLIWMNRQDVRIDDELTEYRDNTGADMVALFVPGSWTGDTCGHANVPERAENDNTPHPPESDWKLTDLAVPFGKRAYSVHRIGCGLSDFTFAHELGHNFGMRHASEKAAKPCCKDNEYLFSYGRGQNNTSTATIMGCIGGMPGEDPIEYESVCSRTHLYSSNGNRNNKLVLGLQAPIIAGFRP